MTDIVEHPCDVCGRRLSEHNRGAGIPICPGIAAPSFRSTLNATIVELRARIAELEKVDSYAAWQQKRGMLADKVDWAILEYDEYMKDDAYDTQRVLDRIIAGLRETAAAIRERTDGR